MLITVCCGISSSESQAADSTRPPNIILVFADDLGWRDVGFQSEGKFVTPHLDQLARDGMVFTNAYAAAGNCAPSRACLLSGTYTPRHHVYAVGSTDRGPKNLQRLVPIPNRSGLAPEVITMAEALRSAGYATGHFGKWHLAGKDGARPTDQGFQESFDSFGDGEVQEGSEGNKTGPPEDPKGVFTLTRKAIDFMKRHEDEPFFCYLPHHAIHSPLQMTAESKSQFAGKGSKEGPSDIYLGCTRDLDSSVGMLLQALKDFGLDQNTLLVFTSDNGATPGSPQEPLRGNKGCYYEGGIREPFIAYWPGKIAAGSVCNVPVCNVDLFPTFLDAAGAAQPNGKTLDGESLVPLMKQQGELAREAIFWHFPGYLDSPVIRGRDPVFRTRPVTVIRKGDWKLHYYHEEMVLDGGLAQLVSHHGVELYNLRQDVGERNDLAISNPVKRDELLGDLQRWLSSVDALSPHTANPAFDPGKASKGKPAKRKNSD